MKRLLLTIGLMAVLVGISSAQSDVAAEELTLKEKSVAQKIADDFLQHWQARGDFSELVKGFYDNNFFKRLIENEKREYAALHETSGTFEFANTLTCNVGLLETVSEDDWRRAYVAMHESALLCATYALNQQGKQLYDDGRLNDSELTDLFETMLPVGLRDELRRHPVLRGLYGDSGEEARTVQTNAELLDVIYLMERINAAIKQTHGKHAYQFTLAAHLELFKDRLAMQPQLITVSPDENANGWLANPRVVMMPFLSLLFLFIAEIDGQYKVIGLEPVSI